MRWLGLFLVLTYFLCVDMVLLLSLVLCDLSDGLIFDVTIGSVVDSVV